MPEQPGTRPKRGRFVIGFLLAVVAVWFAGATGRDFRQKPLLEQIGSLIMLFSTLTMAVQAFTEENYPRTRWVTGARVMLAVGLALSYAGRLA